MPTKRLLIKGKVQGVFFRATAKDVAEGIGVTGYIRNTDTGDVEATVTGTEEQLAAFVSWCKNGPSAAVVDEVQAVDIEERHFEGFKINRT